MFGRYKSYYYTQNTSGKLRFWLKTISSIFYAYEAFTASMEGRSMSNNPTMDFTGNMNSGAGHPYTNVNPSEDKIYD